MTTDRLQPCPSCGHPSDHAAGCPDDVRAPRPASTGRGEPWSIPIREPDPEIPHRYATWIDRMPILPVVFAAVALFVLAVVGVVWMSGSTAPEPEVAGSEVAGTSEASPARASERATTTTTPATSSTVTTTTTTTSTPEEDAGPSTGAGSPTTVSPEPADLPILDPAGLGPGWVAQVSSVPSSAGGNALTTAYETVTRTMPDVVIVRGSEWPALAAGFWVIVEPGFDSGRDAVDACAAAGRPSRDECFGRHLDLADGAERICAREEDGTLTGDC